MTSARKRFANAQNARRCTGPKTAVGKARSARNALRHGLNLPVLADPALTPDVEELGRKIVTSVVGADTDPRRLELAWRIAEAQLDIVRVRHVRLPLFEQVAAEPSVLVELLRLDRYERRARSRRKFAIREFQTAVLAKRNQTRKSE